MRKWPVRQKALSKYYLLPLVNLQWKMILCINSHGLSWFLLEDHYLLVATDRCAQA